MSARLKRQVRSESGTGTILYDGAQVRYERLPVDAAGEAEAAPEVVDAPALVERTGEWMYSILIGGRSYQVAVAQDATGAAIVAVNGRAIDIAVYDPRDLAAAGSGAAHHGRLEIKAPMPGKVIRVLVEAGQQVEEGDGLIVVEAMKMQNEMKSPKSGTVTEVRVSENDTVGAGDVLLVLE